MRVRGRGTDVLVIAQQPSPPVVVLDLDGTLVDSVYQHVVAWQAAFHDVGRHVSAMRVHESIGMGGDRLVAHVAGDAAEGAVGDDVRTLHDKHFRAVLRSVAPLDGASDLVEALVAHGHPVTVASSSPADLVDDLLDLLDVRHRLSAVVTASDGAASKPAPDLVERAVARVGGGPAVVVGDAVWDALSAEAAGARCIGLRSGGVSAERLLSAGASWVHDGPRDLLEHLQEGPLRSH
ncbi:HAD family hydrolase [Nocardioides sp. S5]|nr:HAD family hydrolase [Nocardioides sp. S5]